MVTNVLIDGNVLIGGNMLIDGDGVWQGEDAGVPDQRARLGRAQSHGHPQRNFHLRVSSGGPGWQLFWFCFVLVLASVRSVILYFFGFCFVSVAVSLPLCDIRIPHACMHTHARTHACTHNTHTHPFTSFIWFCQ